MNIINRFNNIKGNLIINIMIIKFLQNNMIINNNIKEKKLRIKQTMEIFRKKSIKLKQN